MFKKKNSKYHSILQSIKKTPSKSNLATRHEEVLNEFDKNKKQIDELNHELVTNIDKLKITHNVSDKNIINIKISSSTIIII